MANVNILKSYSASDLNAMGVATPIEVRLGRHPHQAPKTEKDASVTTGPAAHFEISQLARNFQKAAEAIAIPEAKGPISDAGPEPLHHSTHAKVAQPVTPASLAQTSHRSLTSHSR